MYRTGAAPRARGTSQSWKARPARLQERATATESSTMGVRSAAWTTAATHVAAAALAGVVLRPGTPAAADLPTRAAYVAGNPGAWTVGWAAWVVAFVALLWLAVEMQSDLDPARKRTDLRLALICMVLGSAAELVAHALSAGLLPDLAQAGQLEVYGATERATQVLGQGAGQLFFALGMLGWVRALDAGTHGRACLVLGYLNVAAGVLGTGVSLLGLHAAVAPATGAVIGTLAGFTFLLGRARR